MIPLLFHMVYYEIQKTAGTILPVVFIITDILINPQGISRGNASPVTFPAKGFGIGFAKFHHNHLAGGAFV